MLQALVTDYHSKFNDLVISFLSTIQLDFTNMWRICDFRTKFDKC